MDIMCWETKLSQALETGIHVLLVTVTWGTKSKPSPSEL